MSFWAIGIPDKALTVPLEISLSINLAFLMASSSVIVMKQFSSESIFLIRSKKKRIGRNPKTKEIKTISDRDVVLFKPSKEFKTLVNLKDES